MVVSDMLTTTSTPTDTCSTASQQPTTADFSHTGAWGRCCSMLVLLFFSLARFYVLDQGVNHRMSWSETALYARSWVLEHHLRTKSLGVQGLGFGVVYSPNFAACRQSATDATTGIARWRCGSCKASGVDDLRAK